MLQQHYDAIKGYSPVLAATIIWSGNFIVARILADTVAPVSLVVMRSSIACVLLLPFVFGSLRREAPIIFKNIGFLMITAFLGITMSNLLVYVAAGTSNALSMSLIGISSPIFTIVFARMFLGDTLTMRRAAGMFIAIFGVTFLITNGHPAALTQMRFTHGDFWMLGQAISFAVYSILIRKKQTGLSPLVFLFCMFSMGAVILLPAFLWEAGALLRTDFSREMIVAVLYLGVGPSLLSYLFWNRSVAMIGPAKAAIVYYLLPLFSGIAGFFFLGEPITGTHLLSGALILIGVVLATNG